ncbi:hypothetical protein Tcan_01602, partial [Toxocara canis]
MLEFSPSSERSLAVELAYLSRRWGLRHPFRPLRSRATPPPNSINPVASSNLAHFLNFPFHTFSLNLVRCRIVLGDDGISHKSSSLPPSFLIRFFSKLGPLRRTEMLRSMENELSIFFLYYMSSKYFCVIFDPF